MKRHQGGQDLPPNGRDLDPGPQAQAGGPPVGADEGGARLATEPQGAPFGLQPRRIGNQLGALCFRRKAGSVQVLLVTSRSSGRWVVPKGWPMPGRSLAEAASIEAWQEAGATGKVSSASLGIYSYVKRADDRWPRDTPCVVSLFPLKVRDLARRYPERHERRRDWFGLGAAADRVDEPELSRLIRGFRPELFFASRRPAIEPAPGGE